MINMEIIILIVFAILAGLMYFACSHLENALQEERCRNQVIRERESIASRMLYRYCRRLLTDTERSYIDKDAVVHELVTILHIQGYDPRPVVAATPPPTPSQTESADSGHLPSDSATGGI